MKLDKVNMTLQVKVNMMTNDRAGYGKRQAMAKKFDIGDAKKDKRTLQITLNAKLPNDHYVFDLHKVLVMKRSAQEQSIAEPLWGLRWKTTVVDALRVHVDMLRGVYDALKEFHPQIYKAVELFQAIQQGKMAVLEDMFPDQMEKYRLNTEMKVLERTHDENQHDIMLKLAQINNRLSVLDEIEKNFAQPQLPAPQPVGLKPVMGNGNAPTMNTLKLPDPVFDDDDDDNMFIVKKDESAGKKASENFIKSTMGLSTSKLEKKEEFERATRKKKHDVPDSELFKVEDKN